MPSIRERLAEHRIVSGIPASELEWLVTHGCAKELTVGEVISSPKIGVVENLIIVLSGLIGFYRNRGGVQRRMIEWQAGDVTGNIPYSRMTIPPGEGRVEESGEAFFVHRDLFPAMVRECPILTTRLVGVMLDRARHFQKDDLQRERLVSLGTLAAGLAHEVDNPTAATLRNSQRIAALLRESDDAARALGEIGVPAEQLVALEAVRESCVSVKAQQFLSPLDQSRREEAIADWLDDRGIDADSVGALDEAPISVEMLESIAGQVDSAALPAALRWMAAGCALLSVATEIKEAASRTAELVKAVKGFSHLDRSATQGPVDVEEGIRQTLTILRTKVREKSAKVEIIIEPGLPAVEAVAGELNQVWYNLIANALDAIGPGGAIKVTAKHRSESIVVCVEDNGPGIPPEIQHRIFEPFFTTKPVGKGTGLGLEIVDRLVDAQNGSVEVSSRPGCTAFKVTLPLSANAQQGASK